MEELHPGHMREQLTIKALYAQPQIQSNTVINYRGFRRYLPTYCYLITASWIQNYFCGTTVIILSLDQIRDTVFHSEVFSNHYSSLFCMSVSLSACMMHACKCPWSHRQTCVRIRLCALACVLPRASRSHLVWICPCFRLLAGQGSGRRYRKSLLFSQGWWESQGLSLRQWNHPPFPLF